MTKLVGSALVAILISLLFKSPNDKFSKYKSIEAYEVRPGILVLATRSADGQPCQVVIEKEHYSNGEANLDSTMPHELVMQIVDELVPDSEKGPLMMDKELARLWVYGGGSASWLGGNYKNVSIDIARLQSEAGDIVSVVKWKNRTCP